MDHELMKVCVCVPGPAAMSFDDDDQYQLFLDLLNDTEPNGTEPNGTDPTYVVSETVRFCPKTHVNQFGAAFIPVFYCVNFLLSYLGNGLVLFIIYKYEKLNTVTNVFLLNLVLSNILFASSLPFWATYHQSEWVFGSVMCKLVSSAYHIGFYSSILFLTLMAFDRYLAVVHAVAAARSRKRTYAMIASVVVWGVSVVASVKELILQTVFKNPQHGLLCEEAGLPESTMRRWRLLTYYQQFLLFFITPLFMVMFCYISITLRILSTRMKEKCRAIKLIFVIIFTFFVCWTPYNIVILLQALQASGGGDASCSDSDSLAYALYATRNVAYLYCCISPVFYTFLGKKFQSHFKRLMAKKFPCLKKHLSLSSQSSRTTSQRTAVEG